MTTILDQPAAPPKDETEGAYPQRLIYRSGGSNPGNFRIRSGEEGVSFRDSLSNPIDSRENPPLKIGAFVVVDAGKLPTSCVRYDNEPPGHVTVTALPEQIRTAIVDKGKLP